MQYKYLNNWLNERVLKAYDYRTKLSVIDKNSLTNKLTSKTDNNFTVNIITQSTILSKKLNSKNVLCNISQAGVYRKVSLTTKHYPSIEAHTFMLVKHINGKDRFIKILGRRSLGTYILNTKRYSKITTKYEIIHGNIHRISIYKNGNKKIYVNEIFPKIFKLENISYLQARGEFTK